MAVDWALYEKDVIQLYVNECKTIYETLKYLREKHSIDISVKQFKSKFGGLKKLRANEWKAVIREVRKRQADGKGSHVYLNGQQLAPKRVMREMRRYSGDCNTEDLVEKDTDIGIDSRTQTRIQIRTPSPSKIQSPLINGSGFRHILPENVGIQQGHIVGPRIELTEEEPLVAPELDHDAMDFDIDTSQVDDQDFHFTTPETPCLSGSDNSNIRDYSSVPHAHESSMILDMRGLWPGQSRRDFTSQYQYLPNSRDSPYLVSSPTFRSAIGWHEASLPFFYNSPEIFSFVPDTGTTSNIFVEPGVILSEYVSQARVASGKPGWLASYLTGIDPKLEVLKPAANFVERLIKKDLISSGGKCYTDGLFDTPSQQSLYQMFSIVAFLASNNMLSPLQIGHFLLWALDRGLVEQFSYVMRTKSDSVRACIEAILEGVTLLGQRFPAEIRHFLDLLISTLDLDLSKRLGGKLLHSFAGSSNVDAAKLLVSRGADINFVTTLNHAPIKYGTPLCAAILARDFPMVEYLITAGSDINKRCKTKSSEAVETALTMAIQIGRFEIAKFLLDRGAEFDMELRIEGYNILELAKLRLPKIYPVLLGRLAPENIPQLYQMIDAAEKGNRTLSRFLLDHKIVRGEVLEHALCHSVRMRNLGAVRTLLQRGIDPDVQRFRLVYNTIGCIDDIEDNLPILLAAACSKNDIASDLVYLLVKAGADLNDDVLMKICRLAIENGNTDLLRILAEAGLNAALFGPSGLEYIASEDENIYESGCILDWGTPINTYGMGGKSALQAAAGNGHLLLMQYLIDRGADINLLPSDDSGQTALQTAASAGFTEIVDYLIDVGADVKAPPAKKHGVTVLEAAAGAFHGYEHESESEIRHQEEEKLECTFKNLLALGAPINRADGSSSCVLHRLIRMSRSECLKLAVQAGARIEDREKRRGLKTPLQVAADEGDMEAIQLLLDHGADINSPPGDEFGRTALQAATSARNPDPRIIQLLLSHGADVNARPARKGGVTALQGAAISGDLQIARMLLGYAADVNAASAPEKGRTSLEGAAEHGRLDMVQLLLSRGVKADPIMGFSRAIELAEGNEHFVIADLLRGNEKASHFLLTELDDSLLGLPAQSLPPQGMVFPYAGF